MYPSFSLFPFFPSLPSHPSPLPRLPRLPRLLAFSSASPNLRTMRTEIPILNQPKSTPLNLPHSIFLDTTETDQPNEA